MIKSSNFFLKKEGQGLIEVVAALAVLIIVVTALVAVVTKSIDNSTFSKNKATASSLAQKSMEEARDLRDQNKEEFFTADYANNTCSSESTSGIFSISRTCVFDDDKTVSLEIIVSWNDSKGDHDTKINTYLTNWR
jgi:Tfp pilus assembly protein PilV